MNSESSTAALPAAGTGQGDHEQPDDRRPKKQRALHEDGGKSKGPPPPPPAAPPQRRAAKVAEQRIRDGGPRKPQPELPPAAPGAHPIGLGCWGHERSLNVDLLKGTGTCLPRQSMYGYEKDPDVLQLRQELAQQVRDQLRDREQLHHFKPDTTYTLDYVDMVLRLPCMEGVHVAVNCRPAGTHRSGRLSSSGRRIQCDQCLAEVEAKRLQLVAGAPSPEEEEEGEGWDVEDALRRASFERGPFMNHCCGRAEGVRHHPDVLELVDVRLSLRELCALVSYPVDDSLWFCIYCRGDKRNSAKAMYTCTTCAAAFHRACYKKYARQEVGEGPGWRCASCCAGGQGAVPAAGGGVPGTRNGAREAPAAAAPHHSPQQQHQQQLPPQPHAGEEDDGIDYFMDMPVSSSGSEVAHSSSSSSGDEGDSDGGHEQQEVVSPHRSVPPAEAAAMSATATTATTTTPATRQAVLQPLPQQPPQHTEEAGGCPEAAGIKAAPGHSKQRADRARPAKRAGQQHQEKRVWRAAGSKPGSKLPAAQQEEVAPGGAMLAAGPQCPAPMVLDGSRGPARSRSQRQQQQQQELGGSSEEGGMLVSPCRRDGPNSPASRGGRATRSAAASTKQQQSRAQQLPSRQSARRTGGGSRARLSKAFEATPLQQLAGVGAVGAGGGLVRTPAGSPQLRPASLNTTEPDIQPHQKQQQQRQGLRSSAAASASRSSSQPPFLKRLQLLQLQPLQQDSTLPAAGAGEEQRPESTPGQHQQAKGKSSQQQQQHQAKDGRGTSQQEDGSGALEATSKGAAPSHTQLPLVGHPVSPQPAMDPGSSPQQQPRQQQAPSLLEQDLLSSQPLPAAKRSRRAAEGRQQPAKKPRRSAAELDGAAGTPAAMCDDEMQGQGGLHPAQRGHPRRPRTRRPPRPAAAGPHPSSAQAVRASGQGRAPLPSYLSWAAAAAAAAGPQGSSPSSEACGRAALLRELTATLQRQQQETAALVQQLVDVAERTPEQQALLEHLLAMHHAHLPGALVDSALAAVGSAAAGGGAGGGTPAEAGASTLQPLAQLATNSTQPHSNAPCQQLQQGREQDKEVGPAADELPGGVGASRALSPSQRGGKGGFTPHPIAAAGTLHAQLQQQQGAAGQQEGPQGAAAGGAPGNVQRSALSAEAPLPVPAPPAVPGMTDLLAAAFKVGQEVRVEGTGGVGEAGTRVQQLPPHQLLRDMAWKAAQAVAAGAANRSRAASPGPRAVPHPDQCHKQQQQQPRLMHRPLSAPNPASGQSTPATQQAGVAADALHGSIIATLPQGGLLPAAAGGGGAAGWAGCAGSSYAEGAAGAASGRHLPRLQGGLFHVAGRSGMLWQLQQDQQQRAAAGGQVGLLLLPPVHLPAPRTLPSAAAPARGAPPAINLTRTPAQSSRVTDHGASLATAVVHAAAAAAAAPAGTWSAGPSGDAATGQAPLLPAPSPPPAPAAPTEAREGMLGCLPPPGTANQMELGPGVAGAGVEAAAGGAGAAAAGSSDDDAEPWEDLGYMLAAAAARGVLP